MSLLTGCLVTQFIYRVTLFRIRSDGTYKPYFFNLSVRMFPDDNSTNYNVSFLVLSVVIIICEYVMNDRWSV